MLVLTGVGLSSLGWGLGGGECCLAALTFFVRILKDPCPSSMSTEFNKYLSFTYIPGTFSMTSSLLYLNKITCYALSSRAGSQFSIALQLFQSQAH